MPSTQKTMLVVIAINSFVNVAGQGIFGGEGYATVDWPGNVVVAAGIGMPNPGLPPEARRNAALDAAQQMATQKAYETFASIHFNTTSRISDLLVSGGSADSLKRALFACEQRARVRDLENGALEAIVEIPLAGPGSPAALLLDRHLNGSAATSVPVAMKPLVSGIIVDCRGIGFKPAVVPRILDESGHEIFGPKAISHEWAVRYGVAGYIRSPDDWPRQTGRVGTEPVRVKAKRTQGRNAADIVISRADADAVLGSGRNRRILSECRVVLVID